MTSVEVARELCIDEKKWVYLHGYATVKEREFERREDLGVAKSAPLACAAALETARIKVADLTFMDFYSCFPIAVFNVCDGLGIEPGDPRGLTVTGGLPFFGGPGNSYSMHAIATLVVAPPRESGHIWPHWGKRGPVIKVRSGRVLDKTA